MVGVQTPESKLLRSVHTVWGGRQVPIYVPSNLTMDGCSGFVRCPVGPPGSWRVRSTD